MKAADEDESTLSLFLPVTEAADDDTPVSLLSLRGGSPVGKALSSPVTKSTAVDEDELVLLSSSCRGKYELESNETDGGNGHFNAANDQGGSVSNDNAGGAGGNKQAPSQISVRVRVGNILQLPAHIAILPNKQCNKTSAGKKYTAMTKMRTRSSQPLITNPEVCTLTFPTEKMVTRSQKKKGQSNIVYLLISMKPLLMIDIYFSHSIFR